LPRILEEPTLTAGVFDAVAMHFPEKSLDTRDVRMAVSRPRVTEI